MRRFMESTTLARKRAVVGEEIDHPYGARGSNVQIQRLFARGIDAVARPHFFKIEGHAKMDAIGWRRGGVADGSETTTDKPAKIHQKTIIRIGLYSLRGHQ